MKKTITISAMILVMCMMFAASEPVVRYNSIDFTFRPASARYEGMGESGTASSGRLDSMFHNPASLSGKGFAISIPSVSFTVFNVSANVSDENIVADYQAIQDKTADTDTYIDLLQRYVSHLGTGHNLVSQFDIATALKVWHIGVGSNIQMKIHSLSNGSASLANVMLVPEINAAETIALGLKVIDTNALSLSVGGAAHLVVKQYYRGISANTISSLIGQDDVDIQKMLVWDTPVMGGYAIPFDVGATLGIGDSFGISVTATNLNGTYHMKSYTSEGDFLIAEGRTEDIGIPMPEDHVTNESVSFEIDTPWELNFGFSFAPAWKFLRPVISADLVDMAGMVRDISEKNFRAQDLLLHLNAGAEVSLCEFLRIRGGVNRGYLSVGAGINLLIMQVDASYGWREMGANIGDKPVDALTVRFNIGYDR